MTMQSFSVLFPDLADRECRTIRPMNHERLPSRRFFFLEAYCAEPRCDCRRVMLSVVDEGTRAVAATINTPSSLPGHRTRTSRRPSWTRSTPSRRWRTTCWPSSGRWSNTTLPTRSAWSGTTSPGRRSSTIPRTLTTTRSARSYTTTPPSGPPSRRIPPFAGRSPGSDPTTPARAGAARSSSVAAEVEMPAVEPDRAGARSPGVVFAYMT